MHLWDAVITVTPRLSPLPPRLSPLPPGYHLGLFIGRPFGPAFCGTRGQPVDVVFAGSRRLTPTPGCACTQVGVPPTPTPGSHLPRVAPGLFGCRPFGVGRAS